VLLEAVYKKTMAEVEQGTMGPDLGPEGPEAKYGRFWNGCQRFGLHQGWKENGDPKYRCIDNEQTSACNDAAERRQKIKMSSIATIMLMIRCMETALKATGLLGPQWTLMGASEDLKAAYRQCPLSAACVALTIILLWNPFESKVQFHELWGQPFGAGHAVPNFYRMASWIAEVCRKLLFLHMDHFFDDFWVIEPQATIICGVWCVRKVMAACGFQLDPQKSQLPSVVWTALGVIYDMTTLRSSQKLLVKPRPRRLMNAAHELITILRQKILTPSHAAKLFGKLDFLNQTLFGRVGRVGLLAIKERQYDYSTERLSFALEAAIWWLLQLLMSCPPRQMPIFGTQRPPVILYTDGSSDNNRKPAHYIGAVLSVPGRAKLLYTHAPVPDNLVQRWLPKKNYIMLVELFAGPVALDTFAQFLIEQPLIHWVDNNAALGALVKGYSNATDTIRLVADYWLRLGKLRAYNYVDRVESASNLADDPSRLNEKNIMQQLGAEYIPPNISSFQVGEVDRSPTSWFGGDEQWAKVKDFILKSRQQLSG